MPGGEREYGEKRRDFVWHGGVLVVEIDCTMIPVQLYCYVARISDRWCDERLVGAVMIML